MSVGNSNLTGLSARVAQVPKQTQASQTNSSPRAGAIAQTNSNTPAPAAPAVAAPGLPVAPAVSGTTAPAARGPAAQASSSQPSQANTATAAAMASSATFLASAGAAAFTTSRGRVSSMSGDASEEVGDMDIGEAEEQPDALQEADTEQGSGEINASGSASGPSA